MPFRALLLASVGLALLAAPASAQLLTVDHPGQYTQEDIGRGGLFYNANCFQCHGRDGDQISGIDLRRGLFRRSQSDEDLAQTITRGTPGGMPGLPGATAQAPQQSSGLSAKERQRRKKAKRKASRR